MEIKSFFLYILKIILLPFSILWGIVLISRRWLYEYFSLRYKPSVFTISVGNLRIGGTGKTPHVEYLIRLLAPSFKTALLSRGYGRKIKGLQIDNQRDKLLSAFQWGDEVAQVARKFPHLIIAVAEKRKAAFLKMKTFIPDLKLVVMDDAFQHLSVQPQLQILLTAYATPWYRDIPLPSGRLREFAYSSKYADIIIVTKCLPHLSEVEKNEIIAHLKPRKGQNVFFTTYHYSQIIPMNQRAISTIINRQTEIHLWTGIADADDLLVYIRQLYADNQNIIHHNHRDHHYISRKEIDDLKNYFLKNSSAILFTTEKDWERLHFLEEIPVFVIPIEVRFLFNEQIKFNQLIIEYEKQNRDHLNIS